MKSKIPDSKFLSRKSKKKINAKIKKTQQITGSFERRSHMMRIDYALCMQL